MNKLAVILFLVTTTLLNTACTNNDYKLSNISVIESDESLMKSENNLESNKNSQIKSGDIINLPIQISIKDLKETKYLPISDSSTLEEKINVILNAISKECFNGLPIKATVYGNDIAKLELLEIKDNDKNRYSWKDDYLNDNVKEYTINNIVKNILQEEYKGTWIKEVQLYYNEKLITLD